MCDAYYTQRGVNKYEYIVIFVVSVTPSEKPGYENQTSPDKSRGGAAQRVSYGRGVGSIADDLR
jgi:hypothetical protein